MTVRYNDAAMRWKQLERDLMARAARVGLTLTISTYLDYHRVVLDVISPSGRREYKEVDTADLGSAGHFVQTFMQTVDGMIDKVALRDRMAYLFASNPDMKDAEF